MIKWVIKWWVSEWEQVNESFFLKKTNERLFSYISVYQKNQPNIVLLKLDAKAKPLATLNRWLIIICLLQFIPITLSYSCFTFISLYSVYNYIRSMTFSRHTTIGVIFFSSYHSRLSTTSFPKDGRVFRNYFFSKGPQGFQELLFFQRTEGLSKL